MNAFIHAASLARHVKIGRPYIPPPPPARYPQFSREATQAERERGLIELYDAKNSSPTVKRIIAIVAEHYGISCAELLGVRRIPRFVRPRQVLMYLARTMTPLSQTIVARHIGNRDHTTVLHGFRKIEAAMLVEPQLAADIKTLRTRLGG